MIFSILWYNVCIHESENLFKGVSPMFSNEKNSSELATKKISIQFYDGVYEIDVPEDFLKLPIEDRVFIVTRLASALGVKEILKIF